MSLSINFTSGSVSLDLPSPASRRISVRRFQSSSLSAGGERHVSDSGVAVKQEHIAFESLTTDESESLKDFFENTCEGSFNPFAYTDEFSTQKQVRFATSELSITQVADDVFDTEFILEIS